MKDLRLNPETNISNIKAKDRKIETTHFKYGLASFDSEESAVSVIGYETKFVNFLSMIIAPLGKINQSPIHLILSFYH